MSTLGPGQTIDRYELVDLIGRGGMGEVWEALDPTTDERVALKLIQDTRASEALRRRFAREVRAASKVQHPAVVKVYDVIETDDGDPVMVMELLEGESLAERLDREPEMAVETVADIMLPVVSAVGSAHAHGIVHRDLKPENIFLVCGEEGQLEVRVLDFGIAKLVSEEDQTETAGGLTTTGSILGTPCYMAPEQVFGEKDVDHRVDVWSLGIILYQMLTGILPTKADNVGQVLKIIVTRGIWPLSEAAPDLPEELTAMVDEMLSKERDERPSDLRDVQSVLEAFAGESAPSFGPPISERVALDSLRGANTPAPVSGGTTVDPLGDTAAVRAGTEPPPTFVKRERTPWVLAALAIVAGLAAVGSQFGGEPSEETDAAASVATVSVAASTVTQDGAPAEEPERKTSPPPSEPSEAAPEPTPVASEVKSAQVPRPPVLPVRRGVPPQPTAAPPEKQKEPEPVGKATAQKTPDPEASVEAKPEASAGKTASTDVPRPLEGGADDDDLPGGLAPPPE